jgi:hypothetical protein
MEKMFGNEGMGEEEALNVLLDDNPLSPEEQERLVSLISNPDNALATLASGRVFTDKEKEHLAARMESDPETIDIFLINITESGVDLNPTEKWFVERFGGMESE